MKSLPVVDLGIQPYETIFERMKSFTKIRGGAEDDQIWVVEHQPVFTQGLAGKPEHLLYPRDIPVVQTDRGGQITYHGPGQAVIYLMLEVKNYGYGVRQLVSLIEDSVIATLANFHLKTHARADAPGVYLEDNRKIASLGLKISRGCCYHGVAINTNMDLSPFDRINPCGLVGMHMAQVSEAVSDVQVKNVTDVFIDAFSQRWFANHLAAKK